MIIGHVEEARGHLEEAIRAYEQAQLVQMGHVPAQNRLMAAAIQRELALLHAELGEAELGARY